MAEKRKVAGPAPIVVVVVVVVVVVEVDVVVVVDVEPEMEVVVEVDTVVVVVAGVLLFPPQPKNCIADRNNNPTRIIAGTYFKLFFIISTCKNHKKNNFGSKCALEDSNL